MHAISVSLYVLLVGKQPFISSKERSEKDIIDKVVNCDPDYSCNEFKRISSEGKYVYGININHIVHLIAYICWVTGQSFIKRMLDKNPRRRPDATNLALSDSVSHHLPCAPVHQSEI